jgi:4-carboxymuconolactone decarboxylase
MIEIGMALRRLPMMRPEAMTPEQREFYERFLIDERRGGPKALLAQEGGGGLAGPFNAFLLHPPVGDKLQELGHTLRFEGELPERVREIVILTVARARQSEFEWKAHSRIGRQVGLTDTELESIESGSAQFEDTLEDLASRLALAMVVEREVDDELYDSCVNELGPRQMFEVSVIVGYYDLLALQLRVFGYYT